MNTIMTRGALAAAAMFFGNAAVAAPTVYDFTQGGFTGGGVISGSFTGEDVDMNGEISAFDGEVTALTGMYSGGANVGAFSFDLADLFSLVWELDAAIDDGMADAVEGIQVFVADFGYAAGPGPFVACDGVADCGQVQDFVTGGEDLSTEAVVIERSAVIPLPAPALLLMSGLAALGVARARKS